MVARRPDIDKILVGQQSFWREATQGLPYGHVGHTPVNNNLPLYCLSGDEHRHGEHRAILAEGTATKKPLRNENPVLTKGDPLLS